MTTYDPYHSRVVIPAPSLLPRNPLLVQSLDPTRTEASSCGDDETASRTSYKAQEQESRKEKGQLRQLLHTDQRSFLSGVPVMPMHVCHIINAVRPKHRNQDREYRRKYVEKLLTELNFREGMQAFNLDHRSNLLLLTAQEHYALDLYGLIAFVPSADRIEALIEQLEKDNADWDRRVAGGGNKARDLNYSLDVYNIDTYTWQVLVLYPDSFLADGQAMKILDVNKRSLRLGLTDPVPAPNNLDDWHDHKVLTGSGPPVLARVRDNQPLLLRVQNCRNAEEKPSLFAMIVNAHSKVLAFVSQGSRDPTLSLLAVAIEPLMDPIFHQPPGKWTRQTPAGWIDFGEELPLPQMDHHAEVTMGSPENDAPTPRPSGDADTEPTVESDYNSDSEEAKSDDEDHRDAGLTESEFKMLTARQTSSSLTDRQRSANFMKILYGPRGFPSFKSAQTAFQ